jgi:hypothetical protein
VKGPVLAGLARAVEKDIEAAAGALKAAGHFRIHTFIATSPLHMQYKLGKKPEEVEDMAIHAVHYARNLAPEVEFSPEDATRSELPFLNNIIEKVIDAGASVINIPDTVGYSTPEEFGAFIKAIREGSKISTRPSSQCTATTISDSRWQIPSLPSKRRPPDRGHGERYRGTRRKRRFGGGYHVDLCAKRPSQLQDGNRHEADIQDLPDAYGSDGSRHSEE